MAPVRRSWGVASAAAAIVGTGAVLSVGPTFLAAPPAQSPFAPPRSGRDVSASGVIANIPRSSSSVSGSRVTAASAITLLAVAAAACRRRGSATSGAPSSVGSSTRVLFTGGLVQSGTPDEKPSVALRSVNSCYNLYFKSRWHYSDRARRNLRNRAYNIFMKNKYKKPMKRVLTYCIELEFGDKQPASKEEVFGDIKELLDEACETIDEVCVQGVIHRNTAARRKDRMCRALLRGMVAKGIMEKPEDPFLPAYKAIGYEMPVCTMTREPRPWQLPGWKSPWMLRREFSKWRKMKREQAKAAEA